MVADALFEHIDVLGLRKATAHLTANIVRHGLAAALPKEVGTLVCGRGERSRTDTIPIWGWVTSPPGLARNREDTA
jgi:hypothetical protein